MAAFYTYVYHALHICSDPFNLPNELKFLKSLGLSRDYSRSVIDKALSKFKKSKHSFCHSDPCLNPVILSFYPSLSFKSSKIFSRFGYKVSFRPVNKIKFSLLKILFLLRTGVAFILFHVLLVILVILDKQEDG